MRALVGLSTVVVGLPIHFAYSVINNISVKKHNYETQL